MPPTPTPPVDLVTVSIALATALFGAKAAALVGPYAVIVLGAVVGGAWSTSRQPPTSWLASLGFIARVVGLALLITVPLASLVAQHAGLQVTWMLGPVAAVIGGIGQDWPAVARWFLNLYRGFIERRAPGTPGDRP